MRRFRLLWPANEAFAPGTARNVLGIDRRPDFVDADFYDVDHNVAGGYRSLDFYDEEGNIFMKIFWEPFSIIDEGDIPVAQLPQ